HRREDLIDLGAIRHVAMAVGRAGVLGHDLAAGVIHVEGHHLRALTGVGPHRRGTDATGRSRYDDSLARQLHTRPPQHRPGLLSRHGGYGIWEKTIFTRPRAPRMAVEDLILVSIDDHIVEPADMFERHVPAPWRDDAPRLMLGDDGIERWIFQDRAT